MQTGFSFYVFVWVRSCFRELTNSVKKKAIVTKSVTHWLASSTSNDRHIIYKPKINIQCMILLKIIKIRDKYIENTSYL